MIPDEGSALPQVEEVAVHESSRSTKIRKNSVGNRLGRSTCREEAASSASLEGASRPDRRRQPQNNHWAQLSATLSFANTMSTTCSSATKLDMNRMSRAPGQSVLDRRGSAKEEALCSERRQSSCSRPGRIPRKQQELPDASRLPEPRAHALLPSESALSAECSMARKLSCNAAPGAPRQQSPHVVGRQSSKQEALCSERRQSSTSRPGRLPRKQSDQSDHHPASTLSERTSEAISRKSHRRSIVRGPTAVKC